MSELFLVDKPEDNVLPLRKDPQYIAKCPECNGRFWLLRVDGVGNEWEHILGSECSECGFFVDWISVNRDGGGEDDAPSAA